MRPVIVETLNSYFQTEIFAWLVPNTKIIYTIAFVLVMVIFINRSSKIDLSKTYAFWSGIWAIAFGLVGSRIYWLLQHVSEVSKSPSLILTGGTGSFGGYIGGTLGFMLSLRLYGTQVRKYMDAGASTLGLGIFIARWSCFLESCCFGKISSLPWAIRYPKGSIPYNAQLSEGLITSNLLASLPVHPVQIYDSLNGLLLFLLASWYWPRLRMKPGATFFLFWLTFCITRFGIEFLRGDKVRGFMGSLSIPQFFCLLSIVPLTFIIWWSLKMQK
uniref:Phosphatidylglycerol--prolipoprotein diacylglyceryl transferase n=1 Tax=candidate division WOR-3 bacterium TaxID=2052148 RepID=A0A7V0Z7Z7_UNCW3